MEACTETLGRLLMLCCHCVKSWCVWPLLALPLAMLHLQFKKEKEEELVLLPLLRESNNSLSLDESMCKREQHTCQQQTLL